MQARYRPRSNFARAVLPVVGGLGFFALLALATWGIASVMSRNPDQVEDRLVGTVFEVGNTEFVANLIDDGGRKPHRYRLALAPEAVRLHP